MRWLEERGKGLRRFLGGECGAEGGWMGITGCSVLWEGCEEVKARSGRSILDLEVGGPSEG